MSIELPKKCLRDLKMVCIPYSQISSDCGTSFVCCGHLHSFVRNIPQDEFRVCWKNSSVDEIGDYDRRDIIDTISVLSQALSVDENIKTSGMDYDEEEMFNKLGG